MQTNNKLREALELASRVIHCAIAAGILKGDDAQTAFFACRAALDESPRNCDIGTADEQMKRQHDTMCNTMKACPDSDWSCKKCFAEWSQMPYKEGGDK